MRTQKQPSFSNGTPDQNPATAIRAFPACRNCRDKKVKEASLLLSPSITSSALPASLENYGANLGRCQKCLQSGAECIYPPTRDRAAYSRRYVANLETRVQSLEMVHARLMPLFEALSRWVRIAEGRCLLCRFLRYPPGGLEQCLERRM